MTRASKRLLLRGGRVVTMDAARRVLDGDVLVEGGRITKVGRADGRTGGRVDRTVIDCRGLVILPGLIQAHIHLCQTLFRGLADDLALQAWLAQRIWPLEAAHTRESVYWSAMLGAAELLLGGTTAILDMETVRHTGAAFEALETIGLRATAGKCLMDSPSSPAGLREPTAKALQESADLCARWHGAAEGRLRYCFAPRFAPSCTGPLLRAVSDLAERAGAAVHTHAAETPLELQIVKQDTGHDEIAYLDSVGISGPRAALRAELHGAAAARGERSGRAGRCRRPHSRRRNAARAANRQTGHGTRRDRVSRFGGHFGPARRAGALRVGGHGRHRAAGAAGNERGALPELEPEAR